MNNEIVITEDDIILMGYLKDPSGRFYHKDNGTINIVQDIDGGYLIFIMGAEVSKSISVLDLKQRTEKYLKEFEHLKNGF